MKDILEKKTFALINLNLKVLNIVYFNAFILSILRRWLWDMYFIWIFNLFLHIIIF